MEVTQKVQPRIPVSMFANACERWPEVRGMTPNMIVRFAFTLALTGDRNEALNATIDRRTYIQDEKRINRP